MDPISLILAALAAGAAAGMTDTASSAIKDSYTGLRGLLARRFAGDADAERTLDKHAEKPHVWEEPLRDALDSSRADEETAIVEAAEQLYALTHTSIDDARVHVERSYGVQIGNWNKQEAEFHFGDTGSDR